jgi:hypothetical protein
LQKDAAAIALAAEGAIAAQPPADGAAGQRAALDGQAAPVRHEDVAARAQAAAAAGAAMAVGQAARAGGTATATTSAAAEAAAADGAGATELARITGRAAGRAAAAARAADAAGVTQTVGAAAATGCAGEARPRARRSESAVAGTSTEAPRPARAAVRAVAQEVDRVQGHGGGRPDEQPAAQSGAAAAVSVAGRAQGERCVDGQIFDRNGPGHHRKAAELLSSVKNT